MKVLIVLYNGFTEYEYLIPLMALHHQKIPFDVAGLDHTEITGMTGLKALTTITLDQIDPADYNALLLPGVDREMREETLKNETLLGAIRQFDRDEKPIAAICAAPTFLGAAGILHGRHFCSEIQDHPTFEAAVRTYGPAVRDGHIITALGSRIFHFTALLLEALVGENKAASYREWAGIE
jgi:4-methyl-5(b-hydroxyethyl)-thiazole monophosphate biosynthesis